MDRVIQALRTAQRLAGISAAGIRFHLGALLLCRRLYDLAPGYRHRTHTHYFDDTDNTDDWQREVYEAARALMLQHHLRTVYDVGCGSGYKTVHILGEFDTTGIDLPQTIERVQARYLDRNWISGSFADVDLPQADLVVCSDVIEHVADPDALMRFLVRVSKYWVVISTPDRDLVYDWRSKHRYGPPANASHLREWSRQEFSCYVSRFLHIDRHEVTNVKQATQMIIGRVKGVASGPPLTQTR